MKNQISRYVSHLWYYHLLQGILFILLGVLIIMEPRILIYLGAGFLIFLGFVIILVSWKIKKIADFFRNRHL